MARKIKRNQIYSYTEIENFAGEEYEIEEFGLEIVGRNLIVLGHKYKDITVSFLLESASATTYYYECVYSNI